MLVNTGTHTQPSNDDVCVCLKLYKTYKTMTLPTAHTTVANCDVTAHTPVLYVVQPSSSCSVHLLSEPEKIKPRNAAQITQDTISVTVTGATRNALVPVCTVY